MANIWLSKQNCAVSMWDKKFKLEDCSMGSKIYLPSGL